MKEKKNQLRGHYSLQETPCKSITVGSLLGSSIKVDMADTVSSCMFGAVELGVGISVQLIKICTV